MRPWAIYEECISNKCAFRQRNCTELSSHYAAPHKKKREDPDRADLLREPVMKKPIAIAALVALSGTAIAQDTSSVARMFTAAGITYEYTVTTNRRGHQDLVGRDSRGVTFALRVEGTRVTGSYGREAVDFSIRPRRRAPVEVATTAG
jgi:hypothetical protein